MLEELRRKLPEAFLNEKTGVLLFDKYKTIHTNDPLTKGYIASLYFAYSKHASLFKKMEAFNRGRNLMDAAVKASPNNIELAFLRLSVQMNAPGFLGYDTHIVSDKKLVLEGYEKTIPLIRKRIYEFVRTGNGFSQTEKSMVKPD